LPSASLNADSRGLYEPVHGSAPDIAGRNVANPLATILSAAMMCRYSLQLSDVAERIETAVASVIASGLRTNDIAADGDASHQSSVVGTTQMGDAVIAALDNGR